MDGKTLLPTGAERRIQNTISSGGWTTPHRQHRSAAKVLLKDLRAGYAKILRNRRAARIAGNDAAAVLIGRTDESGPRVEALADAVAILSAMAVEAAINLYGVMYLGEEFHRKHVERLGIVPKLALTVASIERITLASDAEILVVTRRLFELRNQLVHPKAREFDAEGDWMTERDSVNMATQAVDDMERFFALVPTYTWQMASFTRS